MGGSALAEMLGGDVFLTAITLTANHIGDDGARSIAQAAMRMRARGCVHGTCVSTFFIDYGEEEDDVRSMAPRALACEEPCAWPGLLGACAAHGWKGLVVDAL